MSDVLKLDAMSEVEAKQFIQQRLREALRLEQSDATKYSHELYDYYKRLNSFPKSTSTLDVSLKVLVQSRQKKQKNAASAQSGQNKSKPNVAPKVGASGFQAMTFKRS